MNKNLMKEKWARGEVCIGAFINITHSAVIEVLGIVGLDFVILDAEHTSLTPETAEHLYQVAELHNISSVTRIGENSQQVIQKFLEGGSQGVLIPLVNTVEEAQQVVDAVKYPPIGKRGLAGSRAASFGLAEGGIAAHVTSSNEETLITVQIETLEAVRNFDQIVSLDNIDCIFFGPSDLSSALGYPGQLKHPEVLSIIERLGKITIDSGKAAGTIVRDLEDYKRWVDLGFQWVCTGTTAFLVSGAKNYIEPLKDYKTSVR